MKEYLETLRVCPLFHSVSDEDLLKMLGCLGARVRKALRGEAIVLAGERVSEVGVLLSGRAQIIRDEYTGERSIVAQLKEGDMFAEAFVCASRGEYAVAMVSVVAAETCQALMLDYRRIISTCPSACAFHTRLIQNMLGVMADKNIALSRKIGHLSKRTTRGKLLSYLHEQSELCQSREFAIPFDRQELADYLFVERSAMSAELGRMRDEGLISYHKNSFRLLNR